MSWILIHSDKWSQKTHGASRPLRARHKPIQEGGNLDEAVEQLTVATQLDPTHVGSHLGLGRALITLGRKDKANPSYKPALKLPVQVVIQRRGRSGPEMQALLETLR